MQQQIQEKLERYLSFLKQDQHNINLLLEISLLYTELDDLTQAQHYLDKASALNREACLGSQGLLHLKQGHLQEALSLFTEALQYEDTAPLRYNLGFTYFLNNDFPKAWEVLTPIEEEEYLPATRLLMARMLYQEGSLEEAINLLEEYVEDYSNNAEILGFLALLYFDMNNEEVANDFSQRALKLDPTNYEAQLVDIMSRLLTQETSIEEVQDLLKVNPEDSRLLFALGSSYMTQGDFASAIEQFQKTLQIQPEFYDCHIALAWCQLLNDELNEAHETYQNAISLADDLADGWGGLAIIYALNADREKAEQLINKAKAIDEDCFLTQIAEVIYLNHKDPKQAKQQLLDVLTNENLPTSAKLVRVIEELT